jgi:hypothetical protein
MADKTVTLDVLARSRETGFDKTHAKLNLLKVAATGFALKIGKDAVNAASDLNETQSKSNVIFGKSTGVINKWASSSAEKLGLSRQAALEAASGFGDMFTQLGFTSRAAAGMSEKTVQMATDLGSFNNLPTGEVLDMIQGGLRGEYDSLQRVIPNISAARVQQEALNETHKKSASELTAAEKATATLAIVQKDGARAAGDFARTSSGAANQQKILSAEFQNTEASLGKVLLPVMVKGLHVATGLAAGFDRNSKVLIPLIGVIGGAAAIIFGVNKAVGAWSSSQKALNAVMNANPLLRIITLVLLVGTALVTAYKHSEKFRDVVDRVFGVVKIGVLTFAEIWLKLQIVVLNVFSAIIHGAAAAFGWMPGIGGKLKAARHAFDEFRTVADKALHGIQAEIKTEKAKREARGFAAYLKRLGATPITFDLYTRTHAQRPGQTYSQHAAGGYLTEGWNLINERGSEWLYKQGSQVMVSPHGTGGPAGMRSGGAVVLEIRSGGTKFDDALVEIIRRSVRVLGGGDVQVALGRG